MHDDLFVRNPANQEHSYGNDHGDPQEHLVEGRARIRRGFRAVVPVLCALAFSCFAEQYQSACRTTLERRWLVGHCAGVGAVI